MQAHHLLLLAGATFAVAACADQTPTAPRQAVPDPPSLDLAVTGLCTGNFSAGFTPAVTNQGQPVTVALDDTYTCTIGGSSAISTTTYNQPSVECGGVLVNLAPSDQTLAWTGGTGPATSTIHYTSITMVAQALVTEGTVTAGRFAGDAVKQVQAVVSVQGTGMPGLCVLGLGTISRASGTTVLTITSLDP